MGKEGRIHDRASPPTGAGHNGRKALLFATHSSSSPIGLIVHTKQTQTAPTSLILLVLWPELSSLLLEVQFFSLAVEERDRSPNSVRHTDSLGIGALQSWDAPKK